MVTDVEHLLLLLSLQVLGASRHITIAYAVRCIAKYLAQCSVFIVNHHAWLSE